MFWLPGLALVASGFLSTVSLWRTVVWTAALAIIGIGCVANAVRCGRVHCYFTGPFFLILAVGALLYGCGIVSLGGGGWNVIAGATIVGTLVLSCVPEALFGSYWRRKRTGPP